MENPFKYYLTETKMSIDLIFDCNGQTIHDASGIKFTVYKYDQDDIEEYGSPFENGVNCYVVSITSIKDEKLPKKINGQVSNLSSLNAFIDRHRK